MKGQISILLLAWIWVLLSSCSRFEESKPIIPDDTTTVSLPFLKLEVADTGSGIIRLDSIIAADEVYTLTFGELKFGKIVLENAGRVVNYVSTSKGWRIDSTGYKICRKGRCRNGIFRVRNLNFQSDSIINPEDSIINPEDSIINPEDSIIIDPIDTLDLNPLDTNAANETGFGPVYVENFGSVEVTTSQLGLTGKFISLKHSYYTANIQSDSTTFLYFAAGGGTVGNFGFDDVFYTVKTNTGQIKSGKIEFVIGDTCEAQARNNTFTISGNSSQWLPLVWFENDKPCSFDEDIYKITLRLNAYNPPFAMATKAGVIADVVSTGNQKQFRYKRKNVSASDDVFFYYLKAGTNNRITRARIKLKFN